MPESDSGPPKPTHNSALIQAAGTVVVVTIPLAVPQIPIEGAIAIWTAAAGVTLYAARDWIKARLPARWRAQSLPVAPTPVEMSATDVLKRIAFESEWAVTRDFSSPRDHWQETMWGVPLGKEFLRPLASDEIVARGIRSAKGGDEHGHTNIPVDFWLNPKLDAHADRLLCEPGYDFVMHFDEGVFYHDIRLRTADVDSEWPARSASEIAANPSPFLKWAEEWKAAYDDRMINQQMAYEEMRRREARDQPSAPQPTSLPEDKAQKERRRELIAMCRYIAVEYANSNQEESFRAHLEGHTEYAEIRRFLSPEFREELHRQRMIYLAAQGAKLPILVDMFLKEIDRLEEEWRL